MTGTAPNPTEVLSDLIKINNDRADGFDKAIKDLGDGDSDLKTVFEQYSQQSRRFAQELIAEAAKTGGDADTSNSVSGTIHRAWLDVKAVFTGHDRKAVLQECERGEDAIKKAYNDALAPQGGLTPEISSAVRNQSVEIRAAHDKIKALRDSQ